jgi:hypothetical protein
MENEFPKCIYKGGVVGDDFVIVLDADEQAEAVDDDYYEAGAAPVVHQLDKQALISEAYDRGVNIDKRWTAAKIKAAIDGA